MNIFDAEKVIKNVNIEESRFSKICNNIDLEWKSIEIKIDKIIDHEITKTIQSHFDLSTDSLDIIKSYEEEFVNHISEQIDSWFLEILNKFGVPKEEIRERVYAITQNPYTEYQKTHIYIDDKYAFSFWRNDGYAKNGLIYRVWIKADYIPETSDIKYDGFLNSKRHIRTIESF